MQSSDYLIWLDLEMTGLNPVKDAILEIATVITDSRLKPVAQGPSLVIYQPDSVLERMDEWNVNQHTLSGLLAKVRESRISLAEAEEQTLSFVREWCLPQTAPLCGNSVYQDRAFLRTYMPHLNAFPHYRLIDVSSVKELVNRWYPKNIYANYKKPEVHRALDDIYDAVEELKHYRTHFFIPSYENTRS